MKTLIEILRDHVSRVFSVTLFTTLSLSLSLSRYVSSRKSDKDNAIITSATRRVLKLVTAREFDLIALILEINYVTKARPIRRIQTTKNIEKVLINKIL